MSGWWLPQLRAAEKRVLACALLQALKRRGLSPCAFKCGPDYIDSMFHRAVLGVASCNLDLFLSDETAVRRLYARGCAGHGAAIVEGVMGLYDGLGGVTDRASAWHMADTLGLPVLLCLRPKGSSLTLAAQVKGLQAFRRDSHIAALFLTDCSAMLYQTLSPMLERETGLPVLGTCLIWKRRWWKAAIWACVPLGRSRIWRRACALWRRCWRRRWTGLVFLR